MRKRNIIAAAAALAVLPVCVGVSGGSFGGVLDGIVSFAANAAYLSAGVMPDGSIGRTIPEAALPVIPDEVLLSVTAETLPSESRAELPFETDAPPPADNETECSDTESVGVPAADDGGTAEPLPQTAQVISRNITEYDDGLDYAAAGNRSGDIIRKTYGKYTTGDYITLKSGAQVRNCTADSNQSLADAAELMPSLAIKLDTEEPQVLIVHTHTTESYEPYQRDYYDTDFPMRTRSSDRNMVAVGERLAETLASHGISVLHDGTEHDFPAYTGAYDRSEATIRAILAEYPSIKVVIDLHRDAITNPDGSRVAPAVDIDGKSAAQFMIIAGCDDGRFNMPYYIENYKLAALIQNTTEEMYPSLGRAVLFDYRNYNQHITTGSLLIEIGGHANSLDEALYTAELLGNGMAEALKKIAE